MKPPLKRSRSAPDGGDDDSTEPFLDQASEGSSVEEEEKTDNQTLLRLLEEGEKVHQLINIFFLQEKELELTEF